MSRIIEAMLSTTGRITMLGLSRWTEDGGSYRTIQRWYRRPLDWMQMRWNFFIKSHNSPVVKVMRARIVLDAYEHPEWSNQQIAAQAGCTDRAVRKWQRRWNESKGLEDLPRPGAPKRFFL